MEKQLETTIFSSALIVISLVCQFYPKHLSFQEASLTNLKPLAFLSSLTIYCCFKAGRHDCCIAKEMLMVFAECLKGMTLKDAVDLTIIIGVMPDRP